MFKRILVPLDGTPSASAALPAARTIARATDATIVLIRVIEPTRDPAEDAQHASTAKQSLWAVSDELVRGGLSVNSVVARGEPAIEIVRAAATEPADLILMATHGRTGMQRAFSGSVTESVVGASPVPVLVLKPGGKRMAHLTRILVPLDGTAGGALALGTAVALAKESQAQVDLVQVVPPLPAWVYGGADGFAPAAFIEPEWEQAALDSATAYVNAVAARLRRADINAEARAVKGPVAERIEAVAAELDTDLIVMSTHALTGPIRTVLGSVADELVRNSHRPVLLVRRPGGFLDATLPAEAAVSA